MFDLSDIKLPSTVEVEGSLYKIRTNFRIWLSFSQLIQDKDTLVGVFDIFYKNDIPENRIEGLEELIKFYNPERLLPRNIGASTNEKILDYQLDSELIFAAFYEQYKIDLFDPDLELHWHKFLALVSGLHDTKLNDVMSYRCFTPNDKTTYEQQMAELKRAWQLPASMELSEQTKAFNALFK